MAKEQTKLLTRKLVKAYMVFNRGKEVTANEMAQWINDPNNNFGLKTRVDSKSISRMINASRWNNSSILYGIEIKENHPNRYVLH